MAATTTISSFRLDEQRSEHGTEFSLLLGVEALAYFTPDVFSPGLVWLGWSFESDPVSQCAAEILSSTPFESMTR